MKIMLIATLAFILVGCGTNTADVKSTPMVTEPALAARLAYFKSEDGRCHSDLVSHTRFGNEIHSRAIVPCSSVGL